MSNLAAIAKQVLYGFESEMNKLKSHPDRILIISITKIAEIHIQLAESLVNVIAAKLIDHNTHPSFKLPIFYLMDSIMKNVGGPYAALFSRYVVDIYTHSFDGVSPQDREKLEKLLVTWEERKLLSFDVLIKMRSFTNARKEFYLNSALEPGPIQHTLSLHVNSVSGPYDDQAPHMQSSPILYSDPRDPYHSTNLPHSSHSPYIDPHIDAHIAAFDPNMNPNPNPAPYNKPKRPRLFDMGPEDAALLGLIDPPPQVYTQPGPTGPSRGGLKESYMQQPLHGGRGHPQHRDHYRGHSHPRDGRGPRPGTGAVGGRVGGRGRIQNSMRPSTTPGREKGQGYPLLADQYSNYDRIGQSGGFSMTAAVSLSGAQSVMQDDLIKLHRPTSFLTDAFLCEMPVKVDTDHAIKILTNLKNLFESYGSRNIFDDQTSIALSTVVLPRLATLIDTVDVPPPFPHIFRGDTGQASKASVDQRPKPRTGRELFPKFRTEELSRKPTRFVRALYFDRPHQYADDGVRFRSLAELARYTDISLGNKENLRKLESSGDKARRTWFVQSSEWVNGLSNARNAAQTSDNAAVSEQKVEEKAYTVPADEYFPRCPISNETFEQFWDPAKGEFMYRNAVKVLVTEEVDSSFFRVAMPYNPKEPLVRYAIVHKLLAFDSWLAVHRVASLESLLQAAQTDPYFRNKMAPIMNAVQGIDEQNVYVLQR